MSHFTHICHDYTHLHESCTHVNVSGYIYEWVTSHVWTSHVTHIRWRSRGSATPMRSGRSSLPTPPTLYCPHPSQLLSDSRIWERNLFLSLFVSACLALALSSSPSVYPSLSLPLSVSPVLSLFLSLSPSLSQSLSLPSSRAYIFTYTRTHMVPGIIIRKTYWQRSWLIDRVHDDDDCVYYYK